MNKYDIEIKAMRSYNDEIFKELCKAKRENTILMNELKKRSKDKQLIFN